MAKRRDVEILTLCEKIVAGSRDPLKFDKRRDGVRTTFAKFAQKAVSKRLDRINQKKIIEWFEHDGTLKNRRVTLQVLKKLQKVSLQVLKKLQTIFFCFWSVHS